ncbi:MAG: hypothetical protein PVG35_05020 [Desulfobacterales bacterium]|jgi:hypothetical protein
MKKKMMVSVMALFLGGAGLFACSNSNEAESEPQKGVIEQITHNTAQKAVNRIRTPLDRARSAANREEKRLNEMDESVTE